MARSLSLQPEPHEDWLDLPRLPEEPRRLRGDARARAAGRPRAHARRRRRRRARRQHVRVHRLGQAGVDRRHPRDGRAQEATAPCRRLVVTGCLAERYRDELQARDPRDRRRARHRRGAARSSARIGGASRAARWRPCVSADGCSDRPARPDGAPAASARAAALPTYLYDADTPRLLATPRHYAYVKIAEGCDYTCAFCIIPTLRGALPQPHRRVDRRARRARLAGARRRELLLISQDTTFYGIDRGERGALARLLRELNARRRPRVDPPALPLPDDDHRRRCSTRWRSARRSASTSTCRCSTPRTPCCKRMKRPGTRADLRAAARPDPRPRARRHPPDDLHRRLPRRDRGRRSTSSRASSTTSRFDHVGVFTYSHEEGTAAFDAGRRRARRA